MPFVIRPSGETGLANAQIVEETGLPQVISGLAGGSYEVGRLVWAPAPVTVTEPLAPPSATGGIAAQSYSEGVAIAPLDVAADFTGEGLSFALAPGSDALPAGLSLSAAGLLTGTPTEVGTRALVVRATNPAGTADTTFGIEVAAAVAGVTAPGSLFRRLLDESFTFGTITIVNRIPAAEVAGASGLRVRVRGPVDAIYVGHQSAGSAYNFAGPPEQVLFGGAGAVAQGIGETALSDTIALTPNGTDTLLIAVEIDASKTYAFGSDAGQALTSYYNTSAAEAGSTTKTGYASAGANDKVYIVEELVADSPAGGTYPARIVVDGNSIPNGFGVPAGFDFPKLLADRTGAEVLAFGVDSATTSDRRAANETGAVFAPGAAAVLFEITNDLYFGASPATAQANYQGWCEDVRAQGYAVYACTVLPRSNSGTPASFEADRQAVNSWLRANYMSFADGLVDFAANPLIGDAGDETDRDYYADDVHPGVQGHEILAEITRAALDQS